MRPRPGTEHMTGAVVVLRALGLGDFLTGVPAYRALRRAFPGRPMYLAAPAALAGLVPLTGTFDGLLATGELHAVGWRGPPPAVGVDLHGNGPASRKIVAELTPGRLIAFGDPGSGRADGPQWRPGEHEVARWCRLCAESGIPADPADLRLPVPAAARQWADRAVVLHPGAAAAGRRWPAERFAAVATALSRGGHRIVITGSAAESALAQQVASLAADAAGIAAVPGITVAAGHSTVLQLARLVAAARLVIAGDTGVSHLATAFGRPSVTLFGPVPPAEWGPPPAHRHQVLWAGGPGYRGDPHGSRLDPALAAITVGEVLAAAARALGDRAATRSGPAAPGPAARSGPAAPAGAGSRAAAGAGHA